MERPKSFPALIEAARRDIQSAMSSHRGCLSKISEVLSPQCVDTAAAFYRDQNKTRHGFVSQEVGFYGKCETFFVKADI